MRTKIFLLIMISAVFVSSCSKNVRSYADMKRDEKRAIEKLIAEEDFEVLTKYPENGVFGENQFVLLDDTEVYLNVVDSGNGNRPVLGKTKILMRCSGKLLFEADSVNSFSTFPNWFDPIEFVYGYASVTIAQYYSSLGTDQWYYLSPGVESVLAYVGENAIVKIIVPFSQGSSYQNYNSYGAPIYYDKVKFTFY